MVLDKYTRPLATLAVVIVAGLATACDDPFGAFLADVPLAASEATLFDFVNGRLQDPPAFDIVVGTTVRVDQTRHWDFLFQIVDGVPELSPFTATTDSVTDAGLLLSTEAFEGILEAPTEGYTLDAAVPVQVGDVLIGRSRINPTQFLACSQYAKIEILEIDLVAGVLTFRHLVNPNCGDVVLEPGMHGSL